MRISLSDVTSRSIERFIEATNPEDNFANAVLSMTDERYGESITYDKSSGSLVLDSGKIVSLIEERLDFRENNIKLNSDGAMVFPEALRDAPFSLRDNGPRLNSDGTMVSPEVLRDEAFSLRDNSSKLNSDGTMIFPEALRDESFSLRENDNFIINSDGAIVLLEDLREEIPVLREEDVKVDDVLFSERDLYDFWGNYYGRDEARAVPVIDVEKTDLSKISETELRDSYINHEKLGHIIIGINQYVDKNGLICSREEYKQGGKLKHWGRDKDLLEKEFKDKEERRQFVLNSTVKELSDKLNPKREPLNHKEKDFLKNNYDISKYTKEQQERIKNNETLRDPSLYVKRNLSIIELKQLFDGRNVERLDDEKGHSLGNGSRFCFFPKTPAYEDRSDNHFGRKDLKSDVVESKLSVTFKIVDNSVYDRLTLSAFGYSERFKDPCFDEYHVIYKEDGEELLAREFQMYSYNIGQLIPVEIDGKNVEDVKIKDILNYFGSRCGEPAAILSNEFVGTGEARDHVYMNLKSESTFY